MTDDQKAVNKVAWGHIDAGRFDQAEVVLRELINQVDPEDHDLLWHLFGLLGSTCNSQEHFDEGTEAYRRAPPEPGTFNASCTPWRAKADTRGARVRTSCHLESATV
jgi:hypothetical protein